MGGGGPTEGRKALTGIRRIGSIALWLALALLVGLSLLHPPTFDPRDVAFALHEITHTPHWSAMHWGLAVAAGLLGVGMLCWHGMVQSEGAGLYSGVAVGVAWLGVALLLVAFVLEAAGGQGIGRAFVAGGHDPAILALLGVLWAAVLAYGYVAAVLISVATALWGIGALGLPAWPRWFGWLGAGGGLAMALAQPLAWCLPELALWFEIPGASASGLWWAMAAWRLWPRDSGERR